MLTGETFDVSKVTKKTSIFEAYVKIILLYRTLNKSYVI